MSDFNAFGASAFNAGRESSAHARRRLEYGEYWAFNEAAEPWLGSRNGIVMDTNQGTTATSDPAGKVGTGAHLYSAVANSTRISSDPIVEPSDPQGWTSVSWTYISALALGTTLTGIFARLSANNGVSNFAIQASGDVQHIRFNITASGGFIGEIFDTSDVTVPGWIFLALWWDKSDGKLRAQWDNGTIYTTSASFTPIGNMTGGGWQCTAGGTLGGASVDQVVDEVGLWPRALTADERDYLWNGGAGRTWPDVPFGA